MAHETLALLRFRSNTGIPADTVEAQFAFSNASENGGSGGSCVADLVVFYTSTFGPGTLSSMMAGSLDHDADVVEIDVYDISGSLSSGHHGSPITSATMTLDTPSVDTDLPLQAAIGISYHADRTGIPEFGPAVTDLPTPEQAVDYGAPATHSGTSRPKSSRRGRILFGPLNEAAMLSDTIRIRKPSADFVSIATAAAADLAGRPAGWSVWSRRLGALHPVVGGWIADETDVVRRRRLKATTRTIWS